jgi:hypothetical protein
MGLKKSDCEKQLTTLTVITLKGFHCKYDTTRMLGEMERRGYLN